MSRSDAPRCPAAERETGGDRRRRSRGAEADAAPGGERRECRRAFPEEARKIHYDEAPKRGIRGQASPEEAEALRDEGIDFMSLPGFLTRDLN